MRYMRWLRRYNAVLSINRGFMMRLLLLSLTVCWFCGCAVQPMTEKPAITPTNDLNNVTDAAESFSARFQPEEVLVIFDLDNTLLTMDSALGSVAWYDWQAEMADKPGCQPGELNDRFAAQGLLYFLGSMRPVQPDTADIVAGLQRAGHPVLVLTARGPDYYLETLRELTRNDLIFTPLRASLRGQNALTYALQRPVRYQQGVLMVAGQNKGEMLLDLYARLKLALPQAVVMADDSRDNLEDMQTSLKQAGIPGQLFRYGLADDKAAAFDPINAAAQWRQLLPTLNIQRTLLAARNLPSDKLLASCSEVQ